MTNVSVELVDFMGTDLSVVNAARVSLAKESWWDNEEEWLEWEVPLKLAERDAKLIRYLASHKHWTPFAHPQITLRISAPIFLARQLFKHKIGLTENEVSRRYVSDEPEFFEPDGWRLRAENVKQGSSADTLEDESLTAANEIYQRVTDRAITAYEALLYLGVCPEQARMVLPQSMMTEWIWTGSLYALSRVCVQRLDPHAQAEVREVASLISDVIQPLFPESWAVLVPNAKETFQA